MDNETRLREDLASCGRIFVMQQLLGAFGHISVFDPEKRRVYMSPSMGVDKADMKADDIVVGDLEGKSFSGRRFALEWPIHMALHATRGDAIAVAHLHAPYATLFSVSEQSFQPITLEGTVFAGGLPVYTEPRLVTTMRQGEALARTMDGRPAAFLRGHGIALAARGVEEMFYSTLILENEARQHVRAATLGRFHCFSEDDAAVFNADMPFPARATRCWNYYCALEHRWDRQPATGLTPFV